MNNNIKLKEYRNYFNNFKKSLEYKELQSYLLKKQLGLCVKCKQQITLNKYTHTGHLISISDLCLIDKKKLVINYNNYYLMCSSCNLKQHKNTEFSLLKEDIFKLLTIKEITKLIYIRHYDINLRELISIVKINKIKQ